MTTSPRADCSLEAQNAELKARLDALEQPKPEPKPFKVDRGQGDPTEEMSMPRSALEAMAAAVPDHLVRAVVSDHYARGAAFEKLPPQRPRSFQVSGAGSTQKLEPYSGQRFIDGQLDVQDALDKSRARRLGVKPE